MWFRLEETEMSKLYNKAFKVGFCVNILIFVILNIISFIVSYNKYMNRETKFFPSGYSWGVPFELHRYFIGHPSDIGFSLEGTVLNTIVIASCGFALGLLFRFLAQNICRGTIK